MKGVRRRNRNSAVLVQISKERASIMFVDNKARVIFGQLHVSDYDKNPFVTRFVNEVMIHVRTVIKRSWKMLSDGGPLP